MQSSTQLDLTDAFEEWVRAGSAALSVNAPHTAEGDAAVLPMSAHPCHLHATTVTCNAAALLAECSCCVRQLVASDMSSGCSQCAVCCSAGFVEGEASPAEDHSPAAALDHTLKASDDWTLVDDEEAAEALLSQA